jgi:hypothetical protein
VVQESGRQKEGSDSHGDELDYAAHGARTAHLRVPFRETKGGGDALSCRLLSPESFGQAAIADAPGFPILRNSAIRSDAWEVMTGARRG